MKFKGIPLTLSMSCWGLTIHIVNLEAGQVLGSAGLGGGKQRRVMDWEVTVVVFYDGQSRPLNAGEEKTEELAMRNILVKIQVALRQCERLSSKMEI